MFDHVFMIIIFSTLSIKFRSTGKFTNSPEPTANGNSIPTLKVGPQTPVREFRLAPILRTEHGSTEYGVRRNETRFIPSVGQGVQDNPKRFPRRRSWANTDQRDRPSGHPTEQTTQTNSWMWISSHMTRVFLCRFCPLVEPRSLQNGKRVHPAGHSAFIRPVVFRPLVRGP